MSREVISSKDARTEIGINACKMPVLGLVIGDEAISESKIVITSSLISSSPSCLLPINRMVMSNVM